MTAVLFTIAACTGAMIWGWPGAFVGMAILWCIDAVFYLMER